MTTHITKTWFDGEKVVTQEIPESEVYKQEPDAYGYARRLAVAIWEQHYKDVAPQWSPLDDLMGVLTQIDNMTAGLTSHRQPLTDDEIWKFWWSRPAVDDGDMESQFVAVVRAVLAAHGITGEKT